MGSLGSFAVRYAGSKGQVCQNFHKNYYIRLVADKFMEIYMRMLFS
jgi:hypothetical protein